MERKKRSKGRGWESCYVKQIYGTFGFEMRAYGQILVKFCKHTDASKLVAEIILYKDILLAGDFNINLLKINEREIFADFLEKITHHSLYPITVDQTAPFQTRKI